MAPTILATKLYVPPPRHRVVPRPRLVELLHEALNSKLTIISAPVGYGKTTLVSEWVTCCERPVAWLSLDEGDSDPARFLTYLVAALQTLTANIGEGVMDVLQAAQLPPIEIILIGLLNEIAAFPHHFTLVLDDYHAIDNKVVDNALTFLLEHLPSQMHLVIASREDPNLPLAQLRARGQLTELRAADLRFTPTEATEFFNRVMGLDISADDIATLETRTEGWIAGLQLAALSARGREDVHGFISSFAGDDRYIVDYLVEEVLQRQPECIRSFLLKTSILDWLSGPLCDAVTGQEESNGMLETLERGNFFVIPVDSKRQWYRYHHLFAEVLFAHLMAKQPDQVATLHRRASEWYEHNGSAADAIRHALHSKDYARAANLIELAFPEMSRTRQEATLLGWLRALPEALIRDRPVLCNFYAGTLMQSGEMEGVNIWLQAAERWLNLIQEGRDQPDIQPSAMVVVNQEEFRRLPGAVAMHRAGYALVLGNVNETIQQARRALELAPEDDFLRRGGAATLQGLALWTIGDLETARQMYLDGIVSLQRAGYMVDSIGVALALADIVIAQGHLHQAMSIYEQALRFAYEHGEPNLRGTADMLVGMSEVHLERNDLEMAAQCLQRSKEQGEHTGLPQHRYRWRIAMGRLVEAQGDFNGALALLDEAERLYASDFFPNVRPISALKVRVWVEQNKLVEALDWAHERKLSVEDDLSYLNEFEHITLARILLACYKSDHADHYLLETMGLLERLLKAAEEGGRTGSAMEILVLQALAHHAQGDLPAALLPLQHALKLAEPEGYVRIFVDEGPPMAQLLSKAAASGIVPEYTGKLLTVFKAEEQKSEGKANLPPALPEGHRDGESPGGLLSQRELEVLRLIAQGLSNREISQRLFLALNTVKGHNRKIYGKLQVQSRTEAIARARELDLL
jgi:LuxR family transcriptional regulator, maltose regulon positive regulatory protein